MLQLDAAHLGAKTPPPSESSPIILNQHVIMLLNILLRKHQQNATVAQL